MSNSARNGKKQFGGGGGSTAVSSQFLNKNQKAPAIPNLAAVNHFLAEFMRFKEWFQIVAHPPPPYFILKILNHTNIINPNNFFT